jgi:outer membrane lipopolysaccharide assembly protein LptE/RlpB
MRPPHPPLFLFAALLLAGCGYTFDRGRGIPERVAVIPFDNATFRRGLEMTLTRLVDDELRARGPAPASPSEADWLLKGTIDRADERIYSEDADDAVRESSIVLIVGVTLEDRAAEKVIRTYTLRERVPFSDRAGRISTLEQAETEALREIATRIVDWLEAGHPERRT